MDDLTNTGDAVSGPRAGSTFDPEELAAFLASAPASLRGWADEQLALLDAPATAAALTADEGVGIEAFVDAEDLDEARAPQGEPDSGSGRPPARVGRVNLVLVTLLVAAVVIIIQQWGRPATHPETSAPTSMPSGSAPSSLATYAPIDAEREAELKAKLEADPSDITSRQELSERYLAAGRFQEAIEHLTIILEADADNLDALLAIGVAEFNTGQDEPAEQHWVRATEVAPDKAEPWFNLGFLYLARTPPDYPAVERAWGKVIELAPGTELAQTAEAHLKRIRERSSTPTPSAER